MVSGRGLVWWPSFSLLLCLFFFFLNDTATTEIYPLPLHDALPICTLARRHQEPFRAGARHDAIEEPQRLGDRPGGEILVERERLLEQRIRVMQGIRPLRHADLAEVLRLHVISAHVIVGQKGKASVRPTGAIRID